MCGYVLTYSRLKREKDLVLITLFCPHCSGRRLPVPEGGSILLVGRDPRCRGRGDLRHRAHVPLVSRCARAELHRPRHGLRLVRGAQHSALRSARGWLYMFRGLPRVIAFGDDCEECCGGLYDCCCGMMWFLSLFGWEIVSRVSDNDHEFYRSIYTEARVVLFYFFGRSFTVVCFYSWTPSLPPPLFFRKNSTQNIRFNINLHLFSHFVFAT